MFHGVTRQNAADSHTCRCTALRLFCLRFHSRTLIGLCFMFNAVLLERCHGEAVDHNDDRPLASLSPYPKFTLQKRLQTGVKETVSTQPQSSQVTSVSRKSKQLEEKKIAPGVFPPVVCGRLSLSLARGPVGFPVSFHDLAGITQQAFRSFLFCNFAYARDLY